MSTRQALSLFSGGLDSILSVKIIEEQGVDVIGVFFESPFFSSEKASQSAYCIGLPLQVVDITDRFLPIVLSPRHCYGKGLNPCIDCHKLMLRLGGEMLKEEGADFIISGEVLGQRPMSQNLRSVAFSRRLKDLISRDPKFSRRDIELLKWGRHFRINEGVKIIVGRDQKDNRMITSLIKAGDTVLTVESFPGPTVLVTGKLSSEEIQLAASITVSYSDAAIGQKVAVQLKRDSQYWTVLALGIKKSNFQQLMI
ncbi:MAG: hypothetical protein B6I32_00830 [Desulfobacterium sp. 4572_20]|nr:MAG: hypothetical protein B6I32_00830 [Desulfobacterium sp. 4572_20]